METVLALLALTSALTTLATEAVKTMIPEKVEYSKNVLAGIVAIAVGIAVSVGYCILTKTPATKETIVYAICLVALSWICAMVGYDKVVQTITQIHTTKKE